MDSTAEIVIRPSKENQPEQQDESKQNESQMQSKGQNAVPEKMCISVEPVLMLMIIAETISVSVITNFFELRTCETTLNMSTTDCLKMTNETESLVQEDTADVLMWKSLIESLLPAVLSFFIGPWSDVNGRRPLFLVSIFGFFCFYAAWAVMSVLPNIPLYYYLLPSIPKALSGGWVVIFVASYCYIVDITSIESRTYRIGIMESMLIIGYGFGFFLSPVLFKFGFIFNFSASAAICFFCFLYAYNGLQETVVPSGGVNYDVFDLKYVSDMISTTFYKRPHYRRCVLFLLLLTFFVNIVIFVGEGSVSYLWLKLQFHWELSDFTTYQMFSVTVIGVGSFVFVYVCSSKLHLPDLPLATMLIISRVLSSVMLGFAIYPWHVYLASCVAMFSGAIGPLSRTAVSKIIPKHEIGKVFALIAALEAIAPLAGSPLYTLVYDASIHSDGFASVFFLVSALLYSISVICFITCIIIQWRFPAEAYSSLNDGSLDV